MCGARGGVGGGGGGGAVSWDGVLCVYVGGWVLRRAQQREDSFAPRDQGREDTLSTLDYYTFTST